MDRAQAVAFLTCLIFTAQACASLYYRCVLNHADEYDCFQCTGVDACQPYLAANLTAI